MSRTLAAVKTSPHPSTSPNPAGKNVSNTTALSAFSAGDRGVEAGGGGLGRLPSPVASDQGFSLCVCRARSLSVFPIGECQVPEPGVC